MTWIFTCNLTCLPWFCGCISPKHPSRTLVASYFWGLHSSNLSRLVSISAHGLVMEYGGFPSSMKSADLPHSQIFTILRYLKHPNNFPRFSLCFLHVFPKISTRQDDHRPCHGAYGVAAGDSQQRRGGALFAAAGGAVAATRTGRSGWLFGHFRGSKGLVDHWNFCMIWWVYIYIYLYMWYIISIRCTI